MKLSISNTIVLEGASPDFEQAVKDRLAFPNPAYIEAEAHGRWTGDLDEMIR